VLEESFRFPKWVQNALIARLKVMAKLDITERRVPQDGRIQLRYAGASSISASRVSRRSTAKRSRCASSMRRRA